MIPASLISKIDLDEGIIPDTLLTQRHLRDIADSFANRRACEEALARGNPLVYTVSTVAKAEGDGQLHYGLGMLMPGKIGDEYFLTKGHYHEWREASEVYIGLRGEGQMLLEDEHSGESVLLPLGEGAIVYVPGHTAHRTINVGKTPLVYLGVYPAAAGHDYGAIAERNFRKVVVDKNGQPVTLDRTEFTVSLQKPAPGAWNP